MKALRMPIAYIKSVLRLPRYHVIGLSTAAVALVIFFVGFGFVDKLRIPVLAFTKDFKRLASNHKTAVVGTKDLVKNARPQKIQKSPNTNFRFQGRDEPHPRLAFGETVRETADHLLDVDALNGSGVISHAKIVVIVAYMRTGSTLVGKLIEQHPGTFYLFEPIRSIWDTIRGAHHMGAQLTYLDGRTRTFHLRDTNNEIMTEISKWTTCHLKEVSLSSLTDPFILRYNSGTMKEYYQCARSRREGTRFGKPNVTRVSECLNKAETDCKNAPLIAMKFIRLRMRVVAKLLPRYPNMKVIHLNRDPRGVMHSRFSIGWYKKKNKYVENLLQFCRDVFDDLDEVKLLIKRFPRQVKLILYDDLAENPATVAKEIYDFIDVEFTEKVESFIKNSTSSEKDSGAFNTDRKNSSITASQWREDMTIESVEIIQKACRRSNLILGYRDFKSNYSLHNFSIPSRVKNDFTT